MRAAAGRVGHECIVFSPLLIATYLAAVDIEPETGEP